MVVKADKSDLDTLVLFLSGLSSEQRKTGFWSQVPGHAAFRVSLCPNLPPSHLNKLPALLLKSLSLCFCRELFFSPACLPNPACGILPPWTVLSLPYPSSRQSAPMTSPTAASRVSGGFPRPRGPRSSGTPSLTFPTKC